MKSNRTLYFSFDFIMIVTLLVCISLEMNSLFLDNELFNFAAKSSIIVGLLFLTFCVRLNVGGYPFKLFMIFFILFFVQRVIVLSYNPDIFVYPIDVDGNDINTALVYLLLSIIAIICGFSVGISFSSMKRSRNLRYVNYGIFEIERYRNKWLNISFVFLLAHFFVLLGLGHGFGVLPPEKFAWIFRPLRVLSIIFSGNIFLLIQNKITLKPIEIKRLKIFTALYVISLIISGSRSALFAVPVSILFIKYTTGSALRIKAKLLLLLALSVPLVSVYVGVINAYREYLQTSFADSSVLLSSIMNYDNLLSRIDVMDVIDLFSRRMNGFDLLVSSLKKQVELSSYISLKSQVLTIVDSFYPGSLFQHGMDPGDVIPLVLRDVDFSLLDHFVFSKEHMHLIGMSDVYFGYFGGLIFLFIFFFITTLVLYSKIDFIAKLIVANIFIFYPFETGFIDGIFQNFSEQLIMYGLLVMLIVKLNFSFISGGKKDFIMTAQ